MMPNQSGRTYFEDRVRTASPQELTLMLLGSALQSARIAAEQMEAGAIVPANEALAHAESVLSEILGSMRKEVAPGLVEKASALYVYMIRALTDAHLGGTAAPIRNAIRVLEIEHETWRQLCENMRGRPSAPHVSFSNDAELSSGGFVMEA